MSLHTGNLSALISTRICHDLINPIGAISNGLELLGDLNGERSPELDLVSDSAARANAKLGYFRIAFGNASADSQISAAAVTRILDAMFAGGRFRLHWQVADDTILRAEVKLALLLVLCIENALKIGGTCTVMKSGPTWIIDGTGPRVEPEQDLWRLLTHLEPVGDLSSKDVQFAVASDTARQLERAVKFETGPAGISVSF